MSQVATISRVYHDACERLGPDWFEYNTLQVQYNSPDLYEIMRRVGRGKYSEAFQGLHIPSSSNVLIKVLKPVKRSKVKREVKILQNFSNAPRTANIVALLDIVRDPVSKIPSLVTEFIDNDDFRTLYPRLTDREVRYYMFKLLRALDFAHSRGIMHRDVKPHNVMINHAQRKLRLIDWGLAEFYHPGTAYNVRVATRCLKGPELLVGYEYYDYSLDLWSFGCLFAAIIFRKEPFFHGHDNYDQLSRISRVLGTSALWDYLDKYGILLDPAFDNILKESTQKPWLNFVTPVNQHLVCNEAIDLIDSVLKYDHAARLTAREAMDHRYFDPVREQILLEVDSPM